MEIERELAQHHIATLRAIETGRVELAERRLKAYVNFARAFLDAANKRGINFSLDASRSVSMMDWRTPILIIDHAYDGVLAALKTSNRELILAATELPIHFMKMSVEKKDFLFYRRISQIYPAILATSYSIDAGHEKELMADRSWRRLREFAQYFLPELTATHDEEIRKQFASELIWRFGDLMKVAMDHNDSPSFAVIGREMDSLFHDLDIFGFSQDDASSLEAFAEQERLLIWFGFGAWILRSFISKDTQQETGYPNPRMVDPMHIPAFFEVISRKFLNIKQLARVYIGALAREHASSPWHSWEMETLPEGQVHSINFRRWVIYFYTVMGLLLSKTGSPSTTDIPDPFRDLEFWMKDIQENVAKIKTEQQNWAVLIPQLAIEPVEDNVDDTFWDYFLSANETAVKEWDRHREDEIIASPIDLQRVQTFQEQCIEGWNQSSWLVKVFSDMGQRIEKQAETGTTYWAIDVLIPKEAFIESCETHYVGLGRDQAATLGRDTTTRLLSLIDSRAQDAGTASADNVIKKTSEIVTSMSTGTSSLAILLAGSFDLERKFLAKVGFSPRWTQTNPRFTFHEYLGDMDNVPVFFIHNKQSSHITVVDLVKVGKLICYLPTENNVSGLKIRVTEIDEAEANHLIENQPKLLKNADGSIRTHDLAVRDLLLKVRIFVGVKIELDIEAPDAINKISVL